MAIAESETSVVIRSNELPVAVRLSEVVSALSYALDITEGQPPGHAVRTCMIGMRIADAIRLDDADRSSLFYALLLKDLGCSSNAARMCQLFGGDDIQLKHAYKLTEWTSDAEAAKYIFKYSIPGRPAIARAWHTLIMGWQARGAGREMTSGRCERGADIAAMLGLDAGTQDAIRVLDEHWDGKGMPAGISGHAIPLLGRICGLAQTVDAFVTTMGVAAAYDMARDRSGSWFDPALVRAFESFEFDVKFWESVQGSDSLASISALEPTDQIIFADDDRLDSVAEAFARVIDAKSPYTARHSEGVAAIAVAIAEEIGLPEHDRQTLWRAGLLHDIGKLGVSNLILDKPGKLTPEEMGEMRQHPRYTLDILARVRRFRGFADIAAAHHERLDGSGYHIGLAAATLGPLARILAVADVAEALSADRPYRAGMDLDTMLGVMRKQVGTGLCASAFEGLEGSFPRTMERIKAQVALGGAALYPVGL